MKACFSAVLSFTDLYHFRKPDFRVSQKTTLIYSFSKFYTKSWLTLNTLGLLQYTVQSYTQGKKIILKCYTEL